MQEYKVREGDAIKHDDISIKIVSVVSNTLCRARIKIGGRTVFVLLSIDRAVPINSFLSLSLKTINDLHKAVIRVAPILKPKLIAEVAKEKIAYYDIPNLRTILHGAVPFENDHYTHRYDYWLLRIKNEELQDVYLSNCPDCYDTKKIHASDECSNCHGDGCVQCGFTGHTSIKIACQTCKPKYNLTNQIIKLKYKTQTIQCN